jgi:hypothetical protein
MAESGRTWSNFARPSSTLSSLSPRIFERLWLDQKAATQTPLEVRCERAVSVCAPLPLAAPVRAWYRLQLIIHAA